MSRHTSELQTYLFVLWVLRANDIHASLPMSRQLIEPRQPLITAGPSSDASSLSTYLRTTEQPSQNRFTLDLTFIPLTWPRRATVEAEGVGMRDDRKDRERVDVAEVLAVVVAIAAERLGVVVARRDVMMGVCAQRADDEQARVEGPACAGMAFLSSAENMMVWMIRMLRPRLLSTCLWLYTSSSTVKLLHLN